MTIDRCLNVLLALAGICAAAAIGFATTHTAESKPWVIGSALLVVAAIVLVAGAHFRQIGRRFALRLHLPITSTKPVERNGERSATPEHLNISFPGYQHTNAMAPDGEYFVSGRMYITNNGTRSAVAPTLEIRLRNGTRLHRGMRDVMPPEGVRDGSSENAPYFPNPIRIKPGETEYGYMAFRVEGGMVAVEQNEAGTTAYRSGDLKLILRDQLSQEQVVVPFGAGVGQRNQP